MWHDGAELARMVLAPGEYVIGRNPDANIFVNTPLISRQHALLTIADDAIIIEDLGSSNGTFVAELPISEPTAVAPHHEVRLGDVSLVLRRQRAPTDSTQSQAPRRDVIRRLLPDELFAEKRHTVGRVVAQGGMGAILDAQQMTTRRSVAMKVMLETADDNDVLRFIEEAQVTAQLEHPNIVPVHELGVDEQDQIFYTMKMVRGITLKKVLDLMAEGVEGTIKKYQLPALLTVFQKVCDAIAFAHSKGVLHRDLKPDNIMIGDFGEVLVMDWGLAKLIGRKEAHAAGARSLILRAHTAAPEMGSTMAGTIMGTPYYMAPEQARGEVETLDARADIYSLGAILFEILYLHHSVGGDTLEQVLDNVREGRIDWPNPRQTLKQRSSHLPGRRAPDSLLAVCRKALSLDPAQRYQRVDRLQADLEAYQHGFATSAEKTSAWKNFWLLLQRRKIESAAAAIVLLAVGGLGTKAFFAGREAARALADLKKSAPALLQLGENEALIQNFDSALEKFDAALKLDSTLKRAHWRRAWVFLGLERWSEAAAALHVAAKKDPTQRSLARILPAADELAARPPPPGQPATAPEVRVAQYLEEVGALGEQIRLTKRFVGDGETRRRLVQQRLDRSLAKGTFIVELSGTAKWVTVRGLSRAFDNLDILRGLPINSLDLTGTRVTDLAPLRGMELRDLSLNGTAITDLEPVRGMPLFKLNVNGTRISDLSPITGAPLSIFTCESCNSLNDLGALNGAPLKELRMTNSNIRDLPDLAKAPLEILTADNSKISSIDGLKGKPLRDLSLSGTRVRELAPLAGAPLTRLSLYNLRVSDLSPLVGSKLDTLNIGHFQGTDLSPLIGLPIRVLELQEARSVEDWTPLLKLPALESIKCYKIPALLEVLRRHPTLRFIDCALVPNQPVYPLGVAEFWAAFDALPK